MPNSTQKKIEADLHTVAEGMDVFFLLTMGTIVLFMKAGFAFSESGWIRTKNVTSILYRNYVDTALSCLGYCITGYGLAFGDGNGFCGTRYFALIDLPDIRKAHLFFQYTFASIATTIVSSAVAERCTTAAFVVYSLLMSGIIYPIASHWTWADNGWLRNLGFVDFAGSGTVHAVGGASCVVAAVLAGPRIGRFTPDGKMRLIQPHSLPQVALGSFICVFGTIAFNGGSRGSISKPGDAAVVGKVVVSTLICIASATLSGCVYCRYFYQPTVGKWSFTGATNGSFVGMVVICAGCDQYRPWGSLLVGITGYICYALIKILVRKMRIDDPVDSIPIQLGTGFWGLCCVFIFGEHGIIMLPSTTSAYNLLINFFGGLVLILWSAAVTLVAYILLRYLDMHRASINDETLGLDLAIHNEPAYNFTWEDIEIQFKTANANVANTAKIFPSVKHSNRMQSPPPRIHAW